MDSGETVDAAKQLAEKGRLFRYPRIPNLDNFDVSMVLGIGRADMRGEKIVPFLLAMQYYQIEMYTRRMLGLDC